MLFRSSADMRFAKLRKAHLKQANLRGAVLHDADFREADLTDASIEGAFLSLNRDDRLLWAGSLIEENLLDQTILIGDSDEAEKCHIATLRELGWRRENGRLTKGSSL